MSAPEYRCEQACSAHAEGLLALLEASGNGCYCNYWHFTGDKNAWLERCYVKPEDNRAALVERLAQPGLCGVVALRGDQVCGWLKVTRAAQVARLYEQRVYRRLPCFNAEAGARDDVYTVACLYVAEAERGRGIVRQLVATAREAAARAGGSALEAFPRALPAAGTNAERLRPDEIWMGPENVFLDAGFKPVSDFRPYPVLRLDLQQR